MLNIDYLKQLLIISIALSTITCTIIQKTTARYSASDKRPQYTT